jgi:AraC-like DNA-binding protein
MGMKTDWLYPVLDGAEVEAFTMRQSLGGHGRIALSVVAAGAGPLQAFPGLTDEAADYHIELGERVFSFMEQRRPYLRSSFSIGDLAEMMGVPKYHLYHCFKNVLKISFVSLRTRCRVAHAKRLLLEANLGATTLEAIGRDCGFGTRSNFYRVFQEETGCTPGVFVERNRIGVRVVRERADDATRRSIY